MQGRDAVGADIHWLA